ncbi:hypothetical protein H4R99_005413 [Coemansia sp. RSA 1722]|nr:hypothetical protein IWW45_000964 [Coemansia sp. RSA 485]KAJ2595288.1 hypothetical protein H4R99_005413 [Coemansia sp. RSA 1722]KAJ2595321.1 hypothetical protein GGF39_003874 [Coemansia sp. RSA 1721]
MNCHDEAGDDDYHAGHSHGHGHDHSHGHGHDHSHDAAADTGFSDSLFSKVNIDLVRCLNESTPDAIKQVFKPYHQRLDTTQFVSSDPDDPELLVYVPFTAMIKLKSIFIWGGSSDSAPNHVRVFANRDDLDFESVGDAAPTQEWALARGAREPVEYPVRVTKFGGVRSLTLHFPQCFDGDESTVYFLAFRGEWVELKDTPVVAVYELKPTAADHKTPASENMGHHSIH